MDFCNIKGAATANITLFTISDNLTYVDINTLCYLEYICYNMVSGCSYNSIFYLYVCPNIFLFHEILYVVLNVELNIKSLSKNIICSRHLNIRCSSDCCLQTPVRRSNPIPVPYFNSRITH